MLNEFQWQNELIMLVQNDKKTTKLLLKIIKKTQLPISFLMFDFLITYFLFMSLFINSTSHILMV